MQRADPLLLLSLTILPPLFVNRQDIDYHYTNEESYDAQYNSANTCVMTDDNDTMNRPRHYLKWWQSLQFSISIVFLFFLLMLSGIGVFEMYSTGKSLIMNESLKLIHRTGNEVVAKLQHRMFLTETLASALANLGEILPSSTQTMKTVIPHIIDYEGKSSFIAGGGIWPEPFSFIPGVERRSFFWGRNEDGELLFYDNYNDPKGPGYHGEEWYVPAKHLTEGESFWSNSYRDPYSYQSMVTCSVPMKVNGRLTGIVTIDLKLEGLDTFLDEATKLTGGYIFAVDRVNKFLSFPGKNNMKSLKHINDKQSKEVFINMESLANEHSQFQPMARALTEINEEIIFSAQESGLFDQKLSDSIARESYQIDQEEARLISAIMSGPMTEVLSRDALFKSFRVDYDYFLHEPVLVNIFLVPGTYWKMVIVTPYNQALAASASIIKTILLHLLLGILICFVAMFLVTRKLLISPLKNMTATLADSHTDERGFVIRLDVSSSNELGHLADQFNRLNYQLSMMYMKSQQSEKEYRALFENLQDVLYRTDLDGKVLIASPSAKEVFGYSPDEVVGKNFTIDFYKDPAHRKHFIESIMLNGQVKGFETEVIKKDGSSIWISTNSRLLTDENGNAVGIEGMIRDINEKKQHERVVEAFQLHLKNILDSMPSMLVSIDESGKITQFNTTASQFTGIQADDAIGKPMRTVLPFLEPYEIYYKDIIETRESREFNRQTISCLENRIFNITVFPIISDWVDGMVIILDDISDVEKKEQQLIQAQKMETIGTLAGGIAHDFNNILGSIIGSVSLMQHKLKSRNLLPTEIATYLDTMEASGQRASALVGQLLMLTRRQDQTFTSVNLNQVVKNIMMICENSFDKSITLIPVYYPSTAIINADSMQIEQVLLNLCVNASHAMTSMKEKSSQQGGKLTVCVEEAVTDRFFYSEHPGAAEGEYWRLSIHDSGVGMDSNTIARIFDPFFTTKDKGQGTGLGLAMAYNIVQQHNGFIDVYSEPGHGTTFSLFFPKYIEVQSVLESAPKINITKGSGTILLIDDDQLIRGVACSMIEECGYRVLTAENGQIGLERYLQHRETIDAVLLDMVMPVKSGLETYKELKAIAPECKVILASGFKEDARVLKVMELGADFFIQKPYTLQEISQVLATLLNS
ncbi:PAS domain S-box protein [Desulfosediminicola flagellatus]|uniref:PAS domain S-box protein n=1 Tax=Desulfosediminicola flagellatus TaxID=2569541 RepID=UPI0010AD91F8|nr:PAS domain S-box protein [Desulfosediminicola flagellatus]